MTLTLANYLVQLARGTKLDFVGLAILFILSLLVLLALLLTVRFNGTTQSHAPLSLTLPLTSTPVELSPPRELLSPLQAETLQLARDMRAFLKEVGPAPVKQQWRSGSGDPDVLQHMEQTAATELNYRNRLNGGFQLRLADRLIVAIHKMEADNVLIRIPPHAPATGGQSEENVRECIRGLEDAVLVLEDRR